MNEPFCEKASPKTLEQNIADEKEVIKRLSHDLVSCADAMETGCRGAKQDYRLISVGLYEAKIRLLKLQGKDVPTFLRSCLARAEKRVGLR